MLDIENEKFLDIKKKSHIKIFNSKIENQIGGEVSMNGTGKCMYQAKLESI